MPEAFYPTKPVTVQSLPEGEYNGIWAGQRVIFRTPEGQIIAITKVAAPGRTPCLVTIRAKSIHVEAVGV